MEANQRKAAKRKAERASKKAAEDAVYARAAAVHKVERSAGFRVSSTASSSADRLAMDEQGMESRLPEAENAYGGPEGLTQRPAVEGRAAVEQQSAIDALLAAQVAEELEGRHAGTAGGAAGPQTQMQRSTE